MDNVMIAQVMGFLAIMCFAIAAQQKTKSRVLICMTCAAFLYSIQYTLLGAYSAVAINIIGGAKDIIFYFYAKKDKDIPLSILLIYNAIIIIAGVFTYTGLLSLIPTILSIVYATCIWQKNLKIFRIASVIITISWIFFNLSVFAYVSVIGNCFQLLSAIIAIIRLDILKKAEEN